MPQQTKGTGEAQSLAGELAVYVRNIAGIDECEVTIGEGVTVLKGRNATNRTSFLQAMNGVLGGSRTSLNSNAEEGEVRLSADDDVYERVYTRSRSGTTVSGDPFSNEQTVIDHFVVLSKDNPIRRAVETGGDLYDLIMEAVDTAQIDARIRELRRQKEELDERIERVLSRREDLPDLEEESQRLHGEIEALDEKREGLREEVAMAETDVETAQETEELIERLEDARTELSEVNKQIDVVNAEIEALDEELTDLETRFEEVSDGGDIDLDEIKRNLEQARTRMRDLESTITSLTSVVEFNEGIVKGEGEFVAIQPDDKNPTEELGPAGQQSVVCWTCGSKVERADIRDRLDDLRDLITDKRSDLDEVEDQITNLQGRKREIESEHEKRRDLERKYERTERRLKEKRTEHQELEKRMSDLRETVDTLETEAAEMEELRESDILERYEELSSLEFERGQLEQQLAEVESEIEEIGEFPDLDELEAEREQLVEALAQERQRIDHIETEVVENFNHHMEMILDLLEYENIARIWLEKQTVEGGRGRSATTFDLHIVREDVDGAVYEDTSEHLSESEKEVLGLVVTLSGYLAHNTYDVAPVILLDSLEAIDSERIARLIEYFAEYATYVVTALLHEDAQSLSDAYQTIPADALR